MRAGGGEKDCGRGDAGCDSPVDELGRSAPLPPRSGGEGSGVGGASTGSVLVGPLPTPEPTERASLVSSPPRAMRAGGGEKEDCGMGDPGCDSPVDALGRSTPLPPRSGGEGSGVGGASTGSALVGPLPTPEPTERASLVSSPRGGGEKDDARALPAIVASRFVTSSPTPRVEARARCAAASPPERRSLELSGGGCNPVEEPMPLSPRLIAGLSSSAKAGPIGCTSGRWARDFGVLPGFLGFSGFFAIRRIWARCPDQETHCPEIDFATRFERMIALSWIDHMANY
jgi:hypothetical protein